MVLAIFKHVVVPSPERNGATALSTEGGTVTQGSGTQMEDAINELKML